MNPTLEGDAPSYVDDSLQKALAQQVDEQCMKIRNDLMARLKDKVEERIQAIDAERSTILAEEVAQKAELLSKKFKDLEKQYEISIDGRRIVENSSKSARMRYDKLNVRLMNSGLRIHQLKPKTEQMDSRIFLQKAVQNGMNYSKAAAEVHELLERIKVIAEEHDEVKTKVDLAHSDYIELNTSLEAARLKLQRETESYAQKEAELAEARRLVEKKSAELSRVKNQIVEVKAANDKLRAEL